MNKKICKSERIFVAGANGMVGNSIKRSLIKLGYGLKEHNGLLLTPSRKELNLLNSNEVETWFIKNKPTVVILAAAKVGGIKANISMPSDFILENLKIQNNVIENSWKANVKRFLFFGSSCIYPKFARQPIKEEYLLDGPLETTNEWYAIAKIAGLKLCEALRKQHGFNAISLMPTNLYGPGDNYHPENSHVLPSMINKFYKAKIKGIEEVNCWGTGSPRREFLFVDDLAEALIFILENLPIEKEFSSDNLNNDYGTFNIGTGLDITIKELAKLISSIVGYKGKIIWDSSKPDGTPRKLLNVSKLKKLGWSAKTSLEKGIRITFESYLKELKSNTIRI